ncbi:hypothetical protein L596_009444 [Steinernema carpocapsae]|uniref:DUF7808 domain-containing protein n=1 Tax=Steinernema carpocapsae TaxID=34508 RepID=A0A4U5PG58_STECR|nr:hypothetical protein L596_009444 [Steinernema carpocapsae]
MLSPQNPDSKTDRAYPSFGPLSPENNAFGVPVGCAHTLTRISFSLHFLRSRKMLLRCAFLVLFLAFCSAQLDKFRWPRWEERTIDCTSSGRRDGCVLIARNAKVERDPAKYKCRREPMPKNEWNTLAKNSTTRLACPIGCEPDADLSVIQKKPANNTLCQKYYTYGKYRDHNEGEWYLWLTEPCVANLTTHCRFKDIPLYNDGSTAGNSN